MAKKARRFRKTPQGHQHARRERKALPKIILHQSGSADGGGDFPVSVTGEDTYEFWVPPTREDWKEIKSLAKDYTSDFAIPHQENYWMTDGFSEFMSFGVFNNCVVGFYNRELAFAVASYQIMGRKSKIPPAQKWFLAEDAICRVTRCWEYLMQSVTALIGLDRVATKGVMESLLRRSALDSHLLTPDSVNGLTQVVYTARSPDEALSSIKAGRREVPYLAVDRAAKNLRKEIHAKYEELPWLARVFELAREPAILDLDTLRNGIEHWSPAGSPIRRTIATNREVTIRGGTEIAQYKVLFSLLQNAMGKTKEAIQLTRQALYAYDIPNTLDADSEALIVERIRCNLCEYRYLMPRSLVEIARKYDSIRCPNCRRDSIPDSIEAVGVNQYVFACVVSSYLTDLDMKPSESVLPDWGSL